MLEFLRTLRLYFDCFRCLIHLGIFHLHKNKQLIKRDIERWLEIEKIDYGINIGLIYLLSNYKHFRNLFYYRIGWSKYFLNIYCPKLTTLLIETNEIGPGLFISHGFSTAIGARKIGANCSINQQVTIGIYKGKCPIIGDNVTIFSGAIITGNLVIGNNVVIGANSTIYTDIPDNSTVFVQAPKIIHWYCKK